MDDFDKGHSLTPDDGATENEHQPDYEVGYGKPPKHTCFKKGRSGNPKGRPKGSRNFSTDAKAVLKEPVQLTSGGKRKKVSSQLAALMKLREKALKGDANALNKLLELARTYNDDEMAVVTGELNPTDAEILEAHNQRVIRRASLPTVDEANGTEVAERDGIADQQTCTHSTNRVANDKEEDDDWLN